MKAKRSTSTLLVGLLLVLGTVTAVFRIPEFHTIEPAATTPDPQDRLVALAGDVARPSPTSPIATPALPTSTPVRGTSTVSPRSVTLTTPAETSTSTPSLTPSPTLPPFATLDGALPTPATAVPTAVPAFSKPADTVNILLLGNDVNWPQGGRTDSLVIVSINKKARTANMLSIPRDLYVVIPGWKMAKVNLALPHGHGSNYPGGGGELVKDTVLYNLGIPIDYYVRVGFNGFTEVVDRVGGVEVVVNCPLRDWRLKSPELDAGVEENWEQFTLPPGVHLMDGDLALWYARSRRTTNDFERGRRQQQLLRALLNSGVEQELLSQVPALWNVFQDTVETDMSLPLVLQLAPLASAVRENGVRSLSLTGEAVKAWRVPTTGEVGQLLQWEQAEPVLEKLMQPPALNQASHPAMTVEIVTNDIILFRQAAENLSWHGFVSVLNYREEPSPPGTHISYFGPNFKGSFSWLLAWLFRQDASDVELVSDRGTADYDYRVVLGADYNPCLPQLQAPGSAAEATP